MRPKRSRVHHARTIVAVGCGVVLWLVGNVMMAACQSRLAWAVLVNAAATGCLALLLLIVVVITEVGSPDA